MQGLQSVHNLFYQNLVDGINPLDFMFNQRDFVLLFVIGTLAATIILATILITLFFGVLLDIADVLAAILVFL